MQLAARRRWKDCIEPIMMLTHVAVHAVPGVTSSSLLWRPLAGPDAWPRCACEHLCMYGILCSGATCHSRLTRPAASSKFPQKQSAAWFLERMHMRMRVSIIILCSHKSLDTPSCAGHMRAQRMRLDCLCTGPLAKLSCCQPLCYPCAHPVAHSAETHGSVITIMVSKLDPNILFGFLRPQKSHSSISVVGF